MDDWIRHDELIATVVSWLYLNLWVLPWLRSGMIELGSRCNYVIPHIVLVNMNAGGELRA